MMRKYILTCIALLGMGTSAVLAQTAMLQSKGAVTVFEGTLAFENAYKAAFDGDTISLSTGTIQFSPTNVGNLAKSLYIVGSGAFSENAKTSVSQMHIKADNTIIEGIECSSVYVEANNVTLRRCSTKNLSMWPITGSYKETKIEGCCIEIFDSFNYCSNLNISNSTIGHFKGSGYYVSPNSNADDSHFVHCVIYNWLTGNYYLGNSDWPIYLLRPAGHYQDCILGVEETALSLTSPSTYHGNLIYNSKNQDMTLTFSEGCENSGNTTSTFSKVFLGSTLYPALNVNVTGSDGTNVGIWGGSGFSRESSLPSLTVNSIGSVVDRYNKVSVSATGNNASKLRYWWNDDYAQAKDIALTSTTVNVDITLPSSARGNKSTPAGMTNLHIAAVNKDGIMAVPFNKQVRYAYGITPTVSSTSIPQGQSVTIKWTNTQNLKYSHPCLYYSKNNGPFLLWYPEITEGLPVTFYGESDSNYRFIVVVRLEDDTRTSLDSEFAVSIGFQ